MPRISDRSENYAQHAHKPGGPAADAAHRILENAWQETHSPALPKMP